MNMEGHLTPQEARRLETKNISADSVRGEVSVEAPEDCSYTGKHREGDHITVPVIADFHEEEVRAEIFISHLAPAALRAGSDNVTPSDFKWAHKVITKALLEFKKHLNEKGFDASDLEVNNTR